MVMKLTPSLEKTTVQGIDMKCFLIGCSWALNYFLSLKGQDDPLL